MRKVSFVKYSGNGNDFIFVDARRHSVDFSVDKIYQLCHRRLGIGADGVVLLSHSSRADFKMNIFNSDGSNPEMCGNAARCILAFAFHDLGIGNTNQYSIESMHSVYKGSVNGFFTAVEMSELYEIDKYDLSGFPFPYKHARFLNTGVPHAVFEVENMDRIDPITYGRMVRQDSRFEKGTNVTFYQVEDVQQSRLNVRFYERGVEGETYCCGTGIVAATRTYLDHYALDSKVELHCLGGVVNAKKIDALKTMYEGEVIRAFQGEFFV